MSIEPEIRIPPSDEVTLINTARIRCLRRYNEIFYRLAARGTTAEAIRNWNALTKEQRNSRTNAERIHGEEWGVPIIPKCFQTIEFFQDWVHKNNPLKYLTPTPT